MEPLFKVGQTVWIDYPPKCEHGCYGVVEKVAPWDGIPNYDTFEYTVGFSWPDGSPFCRTTVGERLLSDKKPGPAWGIGV